VGGPIDTEVIHEQQVEREILRGLAASGINPTPEEFAAAASWAVECFAPSTYAAMIWRLAGGQAQIASRVQRALAESSPARRAERGGLELRPGIAELLPRLHHRGLLLGLAANQPTEVILDLDRFGLGKYFSHREVSAHHGFHKPDVRLFLRACEDLGVTPPECVMVGDRIDNDIFPASLLGMRTVLFRTGRHIAQQPRSHLEVPDAEVRSVAELEAGIDRLIARG
jgi:HAD superfamily hydrolase (TIGR01509 family)